MTMSEPKAYPPSPQHEGPRYRLVAQGMKAPQLFIHFKCPYRKLKGEIVEGQCGVEITTNVYKGPPSCTGMPEFLHRKVWMTPQEGREVL